MQVVTSAAPQDAYNYMAHALASNGIQITLNQPPTLAGHIVEHRRPSIIVTVILLLLCIVPGVIYLMAANKPRTHHVSMQFAPVGSGTCINVSGGGHALGVAQRALKQLPPELKA